jgi:hypothetical protein
MQVSCFGGNANDAKALSFLIHHMKSGKYENTVGCAAMNECYNEQF